jgi:hypothetical protein
MIENEEVKKILQKLAIDMNKTGENAANLLEEHRKNGRGGINLDITSAAVYYNVRRANEIFALIGKYFK